MSYHDLGQPSGKPTPESFGIPLIILETPKQYEKELPLLSRTMVFVDQFRKAKSRTRETLLDQMSDVALADPGKMVSIVSNFDLISQVRPTRDLPEIQDRLVKHTQKAFGKNTNLPKWVPKKMEQLVGLGIYTDVQHQPIVEGLQRAVFGAPQHIDEAIDLNYNAAWAMVTTSDPVVRARLFSILCFETDIFPATSLGAQLFNSGMFARTDEYLAKHHYTGTAIDYVGMYLEAQGNASTKFALDSKRAWDRIERLRRAMIMGYPDHPRLVAEFERYSRGHEDRIDKLSAHYSVEEYIPPLGVADRKDGDFQACIENARAEKARIAGLTWPDNIFEDPNHPLRTFLLQDFGAVLFRAHWENGILAESKYGMELLTKVPLQVTPTLSLSVVAKDCNTPEHKAAVVREVYETLVSGEQVNPSRRLSGSFKDALDESWMDMGFSNDFTSDGSIKLAVWRTTPEEKVGRLASILEYHRPLLTTEQVQKIEGQLVEVREEIKTGFTKSVGKRGYTLVISDPILRTLDYKSVTFKQQESGGTRVSIDIAGQNYNFSLDENYRVIVGEQDVKRFNNFQDQAWLELLTLSHLKKLMCTNESGIGAELVGGKKQLEIYRRQTVNKIEHLRRQHPGWHVSNEAYTKCLKSNLPIKRLDLINRMRAEKGEGGTLETGLWTYVSPAEKVDISAAAPVKVAFANATEDLRRVIPLGEVSDEELDRMEREILGELAG